MCLFALFGNLALFAKSLDFQRTAEQRELPQAGCTFEELVYLGHLDVVHPFASHANDVVMRLDVAVIACDIVQQRDLARLSNFAKFVQNPMDSRQ